MRVARHLALMLTCVGTVALFLPLLINEGPPVGLDLPAWTGIGYQLMTQIFPDQHTFVGVLMPSVSGGQQLGTTYSLNLMILWLLNLAVSPGLAAKLPCVLTALVLAWGVFRVARSFVTPAFAGLGAFLAVLANTDLILKGMWYDILSIGIALLFWSVLLQRRLDSTWTARRWLAATFLLAATIYAHPMGAIASTAIWATSLALLLMREKHASKAYRVVLLAAVFPCALMLAAPQLAGLVSAAQAGILDASTNWNVAWRRLLDIGGIDPNDGRMSSAMVGVLFLGILLHANRFRRLSADFLLPLAMLAVLSVLIIVERPMIALAECCRVPFVGSLANYADRFGHLWGVVVILLYVVLIGQPYSQRAPTESKYRRFLPGVWLGLTLLLSLPLAADQFRSPLQLTLGTIRESTELLAMWDYLDEHDVDPAANVCMEPTYDGYRIDGTGFGSGGSTTLTHVFNLTPIYAPGIRQISGSMFGGRFKQIYDGKSGTLLGIDPANDLDPAVVVGARMQRLRCGFAVAYSDSLRKFLSSMPSLERVFEAGRLTIFRNRLLAETAAAHLRMAAVDSRRYRLTFDGGEVRQVVLPVAYAKRWTATLSGQTLPIDEHEGLLRLSLPAGLQAGNGELRFGSDADSRRPLLVLALGLVVSLWIAVSAARRAPSRVGHPRRSGI